MEIGICWGKSRFILLCYETKRRGREERVARGGKEYKKGREEGREEGKEGREEGREEGKGGKGGEGEKGGVEGGKGEQGGEVCLPSLLRENTGFM